MTNEEKLIHALKGARVLLGLLKSIIVCKEQFTHADDDAYREVMKLIETTLKETEK